MQPAEEECLYPHSSYRTRCSGRGGDNAREQVLVLFVIAGKKPADGIDLLVLILKE